MDGVTNCTESSERKLNAGSRRYYELVYKSFMDWHRKNKYDSFDESVVLDYFENISKRYKSTSLWTYYSMLRFKLELHHNVKFDDYKKLKNFLRNKSYGYKAKTAKAFTPEEINRFLHEADDHTHLVSKVAMIIGVIGNCRSTEMKQMKIDDFTDLNTSILITIRNEQLSKVRHFTVTGYFYEIIKKYTKLRPKECGIRDFFLGYRNGVCSCQKIGINKFNHLCKDVVKFLKLPNPEMYNSQSFKRSSKDLIIDPTGRIIGGKKYSKNNSSVAVFKPLNMTNSQTFAATDMSKSTSSSHIFGVVEPPPLVPLTKPNELSKNSGDVIEIKNEMAEDDCVEEEETSISMNFCSSEDNFSVEGNSSDMVKIEETQTNIQSFEHGDEKSETKEESTSLSLSTDNIINNEGRFKEIKNDLATLLNLLKNNDNSNLNDEFDVFGKEVAVNLKKLPFVTALKCKMAISEFLTKVRLKHLKSTQNEENYNIDVNTIMTELFK